MCDPYNSHNQYDIKRSIFSDILLLFCIICFINVLKYVLSSILRLVNQVTINYCFKNGIITLKILQKFYIKRINQSINHLKTQFYQIECPIISILT